MNEVLDELNNLHLDCLDDDWVQGIYYSEFLEFGEISSEYESAIESTDMRSVFLNVMKSIDEWLNNSDDVTEEKSWAILSNHVKHQSLLAIIAYYIDHGTKNVVTKEYRNNALLASRLYYKILSVPGYKAYHVYHSQLFAHSLGCLGFPKAMCENENNYFNTKELTREVNSVIKELRNFVLDLRAIIENLQLSSKDMNFEDILSNMVDITGGAIVNKLNVDKIELANISRVIYEMIDILICEAIGEPNKEAIKLLFKCILPKLVAASVDCRNANNLVRASYVTYSGLLLSKYGKPALIGYCVLLQHLCYTLDGLERAEVRTARVSLVVGLMSLLPRKSYRSTVKWLLKLSTTSKISHRHIALEMLSNLLSNEPEMKKPIEPPPEQPNNNPVPGTSNDPDCAPPEKDVETDSGVVDSALELADGGQIPPIAVLTDDDSSQEPSVPADNDDHEMTEDDVAGLLRQRPHTVPHAEILRAVYERVADVSGTLRTRALAVLTDCVASERAPMKEALRELNGDGAVSRLMAVCARCVCDERAAVRRASVSLLHRLLVRATANGELAPAPNDLGILVGLCRDASILVRSAAISALGEMLLALPCDSMFDAFLSGPMHQLSDPENKVQEQVVSQVHQVLVERLRRCDASAAEDPLPWRLLAAVTRHNMRRHLQKACTLLVKSKNCINHRLVDTISTHLGALNDERDLQCLVLLTSVARHLDYSDITFVLDYYYKLAEGEKERDVRLMPLTLELLTVWSRFTRLDGRSALRDNLVKRLAAAGDDGCRIACANLAAQLDPSNLQWATELMQLSERRALDGGELEEWVRAADLSLVAPAQPSAGLLRLFLNALTNPPPDWCESRRGACVAGAGRLCVRSRAAAADAAPALAALLHEPSAPLAARINSLLALTDICTRYTCIVEPLLGSVCGCLSPTAAAPLRRGAARALTRLLLAGYLRLRAPLYYRYCALLADEDHDVREPAEYYVTSCMTADTIYHHFVDCVVHYNKEQEGGTIPFDARQLIYDVMLQRLSLVQKLNVQCRLAREVLEHAADICDENDDELSAEINATLLDAITLLCGPRMKLPKKPQASGGDADIDDLQERVTTNIVSHKMKRTVAEVLVPAVLRLYARLRGRGGQLAAYLVRIATALLHDYRHEIEELIENDEELVERVRQFESTIGIEPSFGNARNLVTSSAPPEPDTPRAPRKRPARPGRHNTPKKRALRI